MIHLDVKRERVDETHLALSFSLRPETVDEVRALVETAPYLERAVGIKIRNLEVLKKLVAA